MIVDSYILKNDNTFVMNDDLFSTYSLEVRSDNSKITATDSADNQSATKITLSTTQTLFKDKKKTEAMLIDLAVALNQAKGDNQRYQKYDLGLSYMKPWVWGTNWNGKLGGYYSKYPNNSQSRVDTNYYVNTGLLKPINESWSTALNLNYTNNMSNVDSNKYNKYSIMLTGAYNTSF
jgi:hypothetical protein